MKPIAVAILTFLTLYGTATTLSRASEGCYLLVNSTPGNITIKFTFLNNVIPENAVSDAKLGPGKTLSVCFDGSTGAQAAVARPGVVWSRNLNAILLMGAYPSAAPAGTYSLVLDEPGPFS
jgi:hypothetical protein